MSFKKTYLLKKFTSPDLRTEEDVKPEEKNIFINSDTTKTTQFSIDYKGKIVPRTVVGNPDII